ncbi:MAG: adenylyltransferase/cytidyltransferase family protein [bacterium]
MNKKNKITKKISPKKKVVVAVSGGFDPIHIGHVRMFEEAKKLGDKLVVIINCDDWLKRKKGFAFMPEKERAEIIQALKPVDEVYVHHSDDHHVCGALKKIKPNIFANGGDRKNIADIPEAEICEALGIEMIFNIGYGGKVQSSSWLTAKILPKTKKQK